MQNAPEAFLLLTLPDSSLTLVGKTENGSLRLECVNMPNPEAAKEQRDVYLVLQVNTTEVPIDPGRIVTRADTPIFRTYTFAGTQLEPADIVLRVKVPSVSNPELSDKLEAFDSILEQYVADFRRPANRGTETPIPPIQPAGLGVTSGEKDLRGHLVLINEETGDVIGEVQENFRINEDPAMYEAGRQNDPVIIEIPEQTTRESDSNALEAFARLVPADQQNWITKSASIVGHAISMTTNLLVMTMSSATNLYISNSSPSPHHTGANATAAPPDNNRGPATASASPTPPPLPPRPPRVLVFLTSEKTRKGLSTVHSLSAEAVKMSSKTILAIDSMIRRAMGARPKRDRCFASSSRQGLASVPPVPPRPFVPDNALSPTPPPYETAEKSRSAVDPPEKGKAPVLPPRGSPSVLPPLPPRSPAITSLALPVQPRMTTKERLLISADLILSVLDDSARKLLDSAPDSVGRIMAHKYGPEAAQASVLLAGTAWNAGLVYVDMGGMGRRALLRRAGRTFIKARLSSNKPNPSMGA